LFGGLAQCRLENLQGSALHSILSVLNNCAWRPVGIGAKAGECAKTYDAAYRIFPYFCKSLATSCEIVSTGVPNVVGRTILGAADREGMA